MRRLIVPTVFLALAFLLAGPASSEEVAGVVRKSSGAASIVRNGASIPAAVGTKILESDTLQTGHDGRLGVILRDDSMISLGADSSLSVSQFRFSPSKGALGLLASLSRGTFEYVSGIIGRLSPDSVRFDTPTSSIGVRGTHFIVKTEGDGAAR